MMNLTARTPSAVSSSASSNPGEDLVWDIKILEDLLQVTIERGNVVLPSRPGIIHKRMMVESWSSQEWKSSAAEPDRSGKPEEISWTLIVRNLYSAGMRILQGTESENFVRGSDAAEFVKKVKDASAKQTEKNVERCRVR